MRKIKRKKKKSFRKRENFDVLICNGMDAILPARR